MTTTERPLANFAAKMDKRSHDECWPWRGAKNVWGYGKVHITGRHLLAHRLSWEFFFGEIPEGKLVLHKCNNRACVNPYHLYLGDQSDNMADRHRSGYDYSQPSQRKLYDEEVWLIHRLLYYKIAQKLIGRMFKVSHMTISRIKARPDYPARISVLRGGKNDN